jgi:small GTP-binding protein
MSVAMIAKVFIAGEGGVGKSTMVERYVKGVWNPNLIMTIGVNHSTKTIGDITLQIWDLGGEDRFRFILPRYIQGSFAGLLVFDTTRFNTFLNLEEWVKLIQKNSPIPMILIGTKADLDSASNDFKVYEEFVQEHKFEGFYLTSSKSGKNIEEAFNHLVKICRDRMEESNK